MKRWNTFFLLKLGMNTINPPTTTRVKISKNVDILPKVYLVHLKSQTLSNRNPFASGGRVYTQFFFRPHVGQRSVFWELGRKPCQHATRGCDKRWMTCIHAGVSRSPREHASVPPGQKALPSGNEWTEWNEWMDFCLIPLSTTGSVEVPGTNL